MHKVVVMRGLKRAILNATVLNLIPTWGDDDDDLIFLFSRSGKVAKGIEFRHSTSDASRIQRKVENGSVLMETECPNI